MKKTWKITMLPVLLTVALFALSLFGVLLTGADLFASLVRRGEESFSARTAVQYLTTRIHQADSRGAVCVEQFGDGTALTLHEQVEDAGYLTRIYAQDGWLRELYTREGTMLSSDAGDPLLELENVIFTLDGSLLTAELTLPGGEIRRVILHLRSAGKELP